MIQLNNTKDTVCVLISCMHQKGHSIIERTNVQTNVVVVNQCDEDSVEEWEFVNRKGDNCHVKFISTRERGLSRSRNMAICNALDDICLICDDDERLAEDYETIITEAYKSFPDADLISFAFDRDDKTYSQSPRKHNLRSLLRTSSVEITFRRKALVDRNICFDVQMGSGTVNGAGEENMFMMTCRRNKLKLYYNPAVIGKLLSADSQWFSGYNQRYFENYGWTQRRTLGALLSLAYLIYWIPSHRKLYNREISSYRAIKSYMIGWRSMR